MIHINILCEILLLVIAIVIVSLYIDTDEWEPDEGVILPREDWTEEEEKEFQRMCEEDDHNKRIRRKLRRYRKEISMSKQSIWSKLKAKGFSDTACAAIMGNMQQESALRSNNVEDRSGILDNVYTDSVDSGRYPEASFISDSYGYGLCQWTAKDRKRALIQLAKQRGVSIADEGMQIDLLIQELQQPMYKMTWDSLNSGASLREMTGTFMRNFERPYDQSDGAVDYRTRLAQAIYDEFAGTEPTPEPEPQPQPEPDTPDSLYLPGSRQICKGMMGTDVLVLQALLKAYGYDCGTPSGVFDTRTNNMLIAYQGEHGLAADGIAGPKTWGSMGVRT